MNVAEIFKFFNSAPNDERWHYASDFADYFGNVLSSGLLHKNGVPNLQVRVVQGTMKTVVELGEALIQGYQYGNTTPLELTHGLPEISLDRIDRIVLRLDKRNNARYIRAFVKEGVSATNPVAPVLQRDNYVFELSLAQIRITKNTASLDPAKLIDERMKEDVCGIVHSLISAPTSVFQQQFDLWFNRQKTLYESDITQWSNTKKAEFDAWQVQEKEGFEAWMQSLEDILNGDVAGNLLAKITKLETDVGDKNALLTTNKTTLVSAVNELFTSANNGKSDIASVVGSPASANNTFAQLKTHIQNAKNKGAANLVAKGTTAVGTESLDSLMSKISSVSTGYGPGSDIPISALRGGLTNVVTRNSNTYNGGTTLTVYYFSDDTIVFQSGTARYLYRPNGTSAAFNMPLVSTLTKSSGNYYFYCDSNTQIIYRSLDGASMTDYLRSATYTNVYAHPNSNRVYAYSFERGIIDCVTSTSSSITWSVSIGNRSNTSSLQVISNGDLVFVYGVNVTCYNYLNGTVRWTYTLPTSGTSHSFDGRYISSTSWVFDTETRTVQLTPSPLPVVSKTSDGLLFNIESNNIINFFDSDGNPILKLPTDYQRVFYSRSKNKFIGLRYDTRSPYTVGGVETFDVSLRLKD